MLVAAHPGLYDPATEAPSLVGSRCTTCGRVVFPAVAIGCDVCGAGEVSLETLELEADDTLHSSATVDRHHGDLDGPFTIGEVRLEAGSLVWVMKASGEPDVVIGQKVRAVWRVAQVDDSSFSSVVRHAALDPLA